MINTIIAIGAAHALYLTILVLIKKNKSIPDYFLATYLFVLFSTFALTFIAYEYLIVDAGLLQLNISLLIAPLFYLYVKSLTAGSVRFTDILLHMAAYILTWIYWLYMFETQSPELLEHLLTTYPTADSPLLFIVYLYLESFAIPFYVILSLLALRRHKKNITSSHSYTEGIDLKWASFIVYTAGLSWLAVAIGDTFLTQENQLIDDNAILIGYALTTPFIFILGYFGLRQGHIFSQQLVSEVKEPEALPEAIEAPKKYQGSGLKEDQANQHREALLAYVASEKPYLRSRLTIQTLADEMDIPTNHLSQVINEQLGQSFYDFVNQHRVEEFKRRVADDKARQFTLVSIAYDCGFNSKSSFNRIFKKLEGCTPTEYVKKQTH